MSRYQSVTAVVQARITRRHTKSTWQGGYEQLCGPLYALNRSTNERNECRHALVFHWPSLHAFSSRDWLFQLFFNTQSGMTVHNRDADYTTQLTYLIAASSPRLLTQMASIITTLPLLLLRLDHPLKLYLRRARCSESNADCVSCTV